MSSEIYKKPVELLQNLLRFNTTNPPGHELACVQYINTLMQDAGIETMIVAKDDQRPNLIARLEGRGEAPPLLLQGHIDVVTTASQDWEVEPFAGEIRDGFIWGRGTLDMKGGVAMLVAAFIKAKKEGASLPGDVILTILSDEEAGAEYGAKFLVDDHPELFEGVKYALGEFGGFSSEIAGKRFYPIMVSEKQTSMVQIKLSGPGGHGAMPIQGGAMAKLGRVLSILDKKKLPMHVTKEAQLMFDAIASGLSGIPKLMFSQLTNPLLSPRILNMLGEVGKPLSALLHNTVSPTIVNGGEKDNVIPSEILLNLDCRILPGFTPNDVKNELYDLLGKDLDIEVLRFDPGPSNLNMGEFETLAKVLLEADPEGTPIPLLLTAVTDARHFAKLGIQTYGFLPMQLPNNFNFAELIHAANERIPVEAMAFGTEAIYQAIQRIGARK